MELTAIEKNRRNPVSRSGSSKSAVQNMLSRGEGHGRPESFRRFQNGKPPLQRINHNNEANNNNPPVVPGAGENFGRYENLEFYPSENRGQAEDEEEEDSGSDDSSSTATTAYSRPRDLKLFPKSTSTTQIFDSANMNMAMDINSPTSSRARGRNSSNNPASLFNRASFLSMNSTSNSTGTVSSSEASLYSNANSNPQLYLARNSDSSPYSVTNPFYVNLQEFSSQPDFRVKGQGQGQGQCSPSGRKDEVEIAQQRRNSSNTRFSEYISSTSSWDGEWEDDECADEFPTSMDSPFGGFPVMNKGDEKRSRFVRGCQGQGHTTFEPVASTSTSTNAGANSSSGNGSLSAAGISSASCPSLNTLENLSDEFKRKMRLTGEKPASSQMGVSSSKSTTQIDKKGDKTNNNKAMHWKSSSCIWSTHSRCPHKHSNRPVTLRFIPGGLQESSRVVWCSERGDFTGTVKWTGKIREAYFAGVEFERPVGNSSGIYGYGHGLQVRLFTCKLGFGRFIPVSELILFEDFYENQKTGFICIICRDDFIEPSTPGPDGTFDSFDSNPKNFMVATRCGHLFHNECLTSWFDQKPASFQHCPTCQREMQIRDTLRIYPAQLK